MPEQDRSNSRFMQCNLVLNQAQIVLKNKLPHLSLSRERGREGRGLRREGDPSPILRKADQKSIPPPPGGIAGGVFGSGFSATIASVVINRPATEAASCRA